jgi:putative FmdB family regulatory protein
MPVYEYQCKACDHEFEREQRISDKPVKKCPSCGAMQAKRLISRTSFVLKGGGWYNDLYSSSKPGKDDSGAKSDGDGKSDGGGAAQGDAKDSDKKSKKKSGDKKPSGGSSSSGGKSGGGGKTKGSKAAA